MVTSKIFESNGVRVKILSGKELAPGIGQKAAWGAERPRQTIDVKDLAAKIQSPKGLDGWLEATHDAAHGGANGGRGFVPASQLSS
jgi:hypothetical protein